MQNRLGSVALIEDGKLGGRQKLASGGGGWNRGYHALSPTATHYTAHIAILLYVCYFLSCCRIHERWQVKGNIFEVLEKWEEDSADLDRTYGRIRVLQDALMTIEYRRRRKRERWHAAVRNPDLIRETLADVCFATGNRCVIALSESLLVSMEFRNQEFVLTQMRLCVDEEEAMEGLTYLPLFDIWDKVDLRPGKREINQAYVNLHILSTQVAHSIWDGAGSWHDAEPEPIDFGFVEAEMNRNGEINAQGTSESFVQMVKDRFKNIDGQMWTYYSTAVIVTFGYIPMVLGSTAIIYKCLIFVATALNILASDSDSKGIYSAKVLGAVGLVGLFLRVQSYGEVVPPEYRDWAGR